MAKHSVLLENDEPAQGTLTSYVTGFILSIVLTLVAYHLVTQRVNSPDVAQTNTLLIAQIIILAFVQFIVQLVFFLHLGKGKNARENKLILLFMVIVVSVLVLGSLWIMANLDYSHNHVDNQTDSSIIKDEGIGK